VEQMPDDKKKPQERMRAEFLLERRERPIKEAQQAFLKHLADTRFRFGDKMPVPQIWKEERNAQTAG
jgi:hypothetical protein